MKIKNLFYDKSPATTIVDFPSSCRSQLVNSRPIFYFDDEPVNIIQITSPKEFESGFYLNKESTTSAMATLKMILKSAQKENITIETIPIKACVTCRPTISGGGAFVDFEGKQHFVYKNVIDEELFRLANSIV